MSLHTVEKAQKSTLKIRQSQFISYIRQNQSTADFRSWLTQIKKDHYDASHACWAYRIFKKHQLNKHSSDAGEPSGTAGIPTLKILEKYDIVQAGIITVRYFGGTKLGKRGLMDAYFESAKKVADQARLIIWSNTQCYRVISPIQYFGSLSRNIMNLNGKILEDHSNEELNWVIQIDMSLTNELIKTIRSSTMGRGNLEKVEKTRDSQTKQM